jgi:hypothetical protein
MVASMHFERLTPARERASGLEEDDSSVLHHVRLTLELVASLLPTPPPRATHRPSEAGR